MCWWRGWRWCGKFGGRGDGFCSQGRDLRRGIAKGCVFTPVRPPPFCGADCGTAPLRIELGIPALIRFYSIARTVQSKSRHLYRAGVPVTTDLGQQLFVKGGASSRGHFSGSYLGYQEWRTRVAAYVYAGTYGQALPTTPPHSDGVIHDCFHNAKNL